MPWRRHETSARTVPWSKVSFPSGSPRWGTGRFVRSASVSISPCRWVRYELLPLRAPLLVHVRSRVKRAGLRGAYRFGTLGDRRRRRRANRVAVPVLRPIVRARITDAFRLAAVAHYDFGPGLDARFDLHPSRALRTSRIVGRRAGSSTRQSSTHRDNPSALAIGSGAGTGCRASASISGGTRKGTRAVSIS
jgi:hypothetical protein